MTNEDYIGCQNCLLHVGHEASLHDWTKMIERIDRAETVGAFIASPMEYQKALPRIAIIKKMAEQMQSMRNLHRELQTVVINDVG